MITLYLDSSSLIKLYIAENASDEVRQDLCEVDAAATSAVSYAETRAAFADRSKPLRGELRLDLGCPQRLGEPASPPFRSTSPTWSGTLG